MKTTATGTPFPWIPFRAAPFLRLALVATCVILSLLVLGCASPTSAATDTPGRVSQADRIGFYQERLERDPSDFVSYNGLASAYYQRAWESGDTADYRRAYDAVTRSLDILPDSHNLTALALLGAVQNARHEFGDAVDTARRLIELRPGSADGYALLGDAEISLGNYDQAEAAYQKAVDIEASVGALGRLAKLRRLYGDLSGAESLLWEAHIYAKRSNPVDGAWVHVQLGELHIVRDELEQAEREFSQALKEYPDYNLALGGLAHIAAANDDYDASIEYLKQTVAKVPSADFLIELGDVYTAAGQLDKAAEQYELAQAVELTNQVNGINIDLHLAEFAVAFGDDPQDAVRQARAARESQPDIFSDDLLAWALYNAGKYEEALIYSDKSLRLGTRDGGLLFHAGMINYRLGRHTEAQRLLFQALELDPHFSVLDAQVARDTLDILNAALATQKGIN